MIFIDPVDCYGHAIYASMNAEMVGIGWIAVRNIQVINSRIGTGWWLVYQHESSAPETAESRRVHPLFAVWGSERNARMRAATTYRPNIYGIFVKPIRVRSEKPMRYRKCATCHGRGQRLEYEPRCYNCFGMGYIEYTDEMAKAEAQEEDDSWMPCVNSPHLQTRGCMLPAPAPAEGPDVYSDDERYEAIVAKDIRFRWKYDECEPVNLEMVYMREDDDHWHQNAWKPIK